MFYIWFVAEFDYICLTINAISLTWLLPLDLLMDWLAHPTSAWFFQVGLGLQFYGQQACLEQLFLGSVIGGVWLVLKRLACSSWQTLVTAATHVVIKTHRPHPLITQTTMLSCPFLPSSHTIQVNSISAHHNTYERYFLVIIMDSPGQFEGRWVPKLDFFYSSSLWVRSAVIGVSGLLEWQIGPVVWCHAWCIR